MPEPRSAGRSQAPSSTRAAILTAFARLALERRYDTIRVADLIAAAGIGRSTFYEHFASRADVMRATLDPILLALATAASGRAARSYVLQTVEHLWDRRGIGRTLLGSSAAPLIQRDLAERIHVHVVRQGGPAPALTATAIASAQIALLRAWLAGEASATADEITDRLIACARLGSP